MKLAMMLSCRDEPMQFSTRITMFMDDSNCVACVGSAWQSALRLERGSQLQLGFGRLV